jgi:iron complex outermembrane receptor protein
MCRRVLGALVALLLVPQSPPVLAQSSGTVNGRVLDAEIRVPLPTVDIQVLGAPQGVPARTLTTANGFFRLELPAGTYSIAAKLAGYRDRVVEVSVSSGETVDVAIELESDAFQLNPIVVTGLRGREEKALDAPASIATVHQKQIEKTVATTVAGHVQGMAGVDVAHNGLTQSTVVTRGFSNVFSGALLVLTDNRYASVPSLRFNGYNLVPTSQMDLERVEVLLGPAAALYGPNSANGVLHMITTSPMDDSGTKLAVTGGERSIFQGEFRSAFPIGEKAGLKLSGTYMRGDDWKFTDPFEAQVRRDLINAGADPDTLKIGARDFETSRWGAEARLDIRPWDDGEIIVTAGAASIVKSIEMTGVGAGMTRDWLYKTLQLRMLQGRLFAQAFTNQSDAGDSFLLRTGVPLVDDSRTFVGQVQHGFQLGDRQDFIYGVDLQRTEPRTGGTINGRYEDEDNIREVGGYLHSETNLSDQVDLVAALRLDHHSELEDPVVSPRAALVFRPEVGHNLRLTFNRAFSTPSTNNLFLDIIAALNPFGVGSNIRAVGVPETGMTFAQTCAGGFQNLCMISPFVPGTRLPALALTDFWNPLIQGLGQARPEVAALVPFLLDPGSQPGDPALATALLRFNQELAEAGSFPFVADPGTSTITRMRPTITNTIEVGYKGLFAEQLLVAADIYSSSIKDFVGPLRAETPTVHYSLESLGQFIQQRLGPLLQAGVVSPQDVQVLVGSLGAIPLGTVAPDQVSATDSGASDLLLSYRNFGDVDLWGADLAFELLASSRVTLTGSYSFVNKDCIDFDDDGRCSSALDIALNAPANKGSVGLRWNDEVSGFSIEGRARLSQGFPMNSGVYVGDVDGYTVIDANVGLRLRSWPGTSVTLTASNLLDNKHAEFIGAPQLGRLILLRLGYEF